jgi:hypothetical protein
MTRLARNALALWGGSGAVPALTPALRPAVRLGRARLLKPTLGVALLALASACTQIPKPELQAYSEAFQAAQSAAEPMIANYAAAERAMRLSAIKNERIKALDQNGNEIMVARFADGYATGFRLTDVPAFTTIGNPPAADAVDRSFRSIAAYNDTLVALAENRNVDEARAQLTSIIGDVATLPGAQALTPLAGGLSDLVTNIFGKAVEIDNRAQFKRLILDGEPKVVALIDLLREHTSAQYETTIRELDRKAHRLQTGSDEHNELAAKIAAWHVVFADYVTLLDTMKKRLGQLRLAVENPRSQPLLARAQAGAGELRVYADRLRNSITQLHAKP